MEFYAQAWGTCFKSKLERWCGKDSKRGGEGVKGLLKGVWDPQGEGQMWDRRDGCSAHGRTITWVQALRVSLSHTHTCTVGVLSGSCDCLLFPPPWSAPRSGYLTSTCRAWALAYRGTRQMVYPRNTAEQLPKFLLFFCPLYTVSWCDFFLSTFQKRHAFQATRHGSLWLHPKW